MLSNPLAGLAQFGPGWQAASFPEAKTIEKHEVVGAFGLKMLKKPLGFEASMLKMLKKHLFLLVFLFVGTSRGLKMLKNRRFLTPPC